MPIRPHAPGRGSTRDENRLLISNDLHLFSGQLTVASAGKISSLVRHADGSVLLNIAGTPGLSYAVQSSTNLLNWTQIAAGVFDNSGSASFLDAHAEINSRLFYRLSFLP
jgi:hypothetical protein